MSASSTVFASTEIRLVLDEFRKSACAKVAALLVFEPRAGVLRLRVAVPRRPSHLKIHPLLPNCSVSGAVNSERPAGRHPSGRSGSEGCSTCRQLFGAPATLVVPVALYDGLTGVVAAFGTSGRATRSELAAARRLASHIGSHVRSSVIALQAERRASELAVVNEIAGNLTSVIDTEVLFPKILAEMRRVIRYDFASLYLCDPSERRLRIVASNGEPVDNLGLLEESAWERPPGIVFRTQKGMVLQDLLKDLTTPWQRRFHAHMRSARGIEVRSQVCVPIVFRGESLGAIQLSSVLPHAFDDEHRELVTALANHAAIAIANAQLYRDVDVRLRRKLSDLTNLRHIGQAISGSLQLEVVLQNVVRGTAEAFSGSGSMIHLLDDRGEKLVLTAAHGFASDRIDERIPVEKTAAGSILRNRQPLFVTYEASAAYEQLREWFDREGIRSFIGVPLVVEGEAIGTLSVHSRPGQEFGPSDVDLMEGLAAQAAIAIHHANLYESVAREKAKLEAVVESLREGLVLVGLEGRIVYASQRVTELLGLCHNTLAGQAIAEVWEEVACRTATPTEASLRLRRLETPFVETAVLTLAQPHQRDVEVQSFAVRGSDGDLLGSGYLLRDVTQQAEVERLKASLLSTASHELRTPLAAIKGFATSLLRKDIHWDRASARDFLEQIDHEADRLGLLVRNLLDMSRIEAGTARFEPEWCDLVEFLRDVLARMAPVTVGHHIQFVSDSTVVACVDRHYLERVIWNLVENAVKYSSVGTDVEVGLARSGDQVVVTVRDQGSGIDQTEQQRIFEPFYRATRGPSPAGLGLGLAICKRIVEAHDGTIDVQSEPGLGSTFAVSLPQHVEVGVI